MTLEELNSLPQEEAINNLMICCGSSAWASKMASERPFSSENDLYQKAEIIWKNQLDKTDWLEAFAAHPKIGDLESLRKKYGSAKKWAEDEQKGTAEASEKVLKRLADLNQTYEDKFGFIFIVCATGKSAEEMLAILESRLENVPANEILIAAEEQQKITEIRLKKLLD